MAIRIPLGRVPSASEGFSRMTYPLRHKNILVVLTQLTATVVPPVAMFDAFTVPVDRLPLAKLVVCANTERIRVLSSRAPTMEPPRARGVMARHGRLEIGRSRFDSWLAQVFFTSPSSKWRSQLDRPEEGRVC